MTGRREYHVPQEVLTFFVPVLSGGGVGATRTARVWPVSEPRSDAHDYTPHVDQGSTPSRIKVLLADDHTMFREGLAAILATQGGVEVVGQSPNDERALAMARAKKSDVVIMQVETSLERARELISRMLALYQQPKVIICTMTEDPAYLREILSLGVSAYLHKNSSSAELISVMSTAVLKPEEANIVVAMPREALEQSQDGGGSVLTRREMEILLCAARGSTNHHIGSSLNLSEKTVKRHLANINEKMEVHSRTEAARVALQEQWFTVSEISVDADGYGDREGTQV